MIDVAKNFLSGISEEQLRKQIEEFRKIDLQTISDEDLVRSFLSAISTEVGDGTTVTHLFPEFAIVPAKTRLYRARSLKKEDHFVPLKGMLTEQDAWNPPPHLVGKRGRLNLAGESLLYVTMSANVTVDEVNIPDDERFSLIVYEAKQDINVVKIGIKTNSPLFTEAENAKINIIHGFLGEEFSKVVGDGEEHLYRVPEMITKHYFDLPRESQDAWLYESIACNAFPEQYNICFKPDIAREVLNLIGVMFPKVYRSGNVYNYRDTPLVAVGFDETGNFIYRELDSVSRQEIFKLPI